jgi:hypothetical protein
MILAAAALPLLLLAGPLSPSRACITTIQAATDAAHLVRGNASKLQRRTGRVGLRDLRIAVRAIPPASPRRPNLCFNRERTGFPQAVCNSNEPGYGDCVWSGVDGVPWEGDFEWSSDYRNPEVPFYQVHFGRPMTVGEVRLWLRRVYTLADFELRVLPEQGDWVTVQTVKGNTETLRTFTFASRRLRAVGVFCTTGPAIQPTIRRILELEAFAPAPSKPKRPASFGYRLALPAGRDRWIEVREAYGEGEALREVDYEVRLDGRRIHRRQYRCDGAGAVAYAVQAPAGPARAATLQFVDTSGQGLAITRVRTYNDPVELAGSRGLLKPMLVAPRIEIRPPYTQPEPAAALQAWADAARSASSFVRPGLLAIVGYANPDADAVAARIRAYAALAARTQTPWVLQLSSWWADTPLRAPDGLGGYFGDIQYQQIAYSRHDTYDDPGLREFMEAEAPGSYRPQYGLTTPNLWSNTPWLTMNNDRLNAFKVRCLKAAVAVVNQVRAEPGGDLLQAIVTDDEPIYWPRITDWMERGYASVNGGVARSDLMLDFNPAAVRAAARDGVKLDPADGLSQTERQWLHTNNARYAALICGAIHDTLDAPTAGRPDLRNRIYNYILAQPLYPLCDFGHPGWELGIVPGAAVGLEAFDERYFARARELGPLANSDLECANPSPEGALSFEPNVRAWHDTGCSFVQLCNPGPAGNWGKLFQAASGWNARERLAQRAISALLQEEAAKEWRSAVYR